MIPNDLDLQVFSWLHSEAPDIDPAFGPISFITKKKNDDQ
jgi:hypothetical protein